MNRLTRIAITTSCFSLCAAAAIVTNFVSEQSAVSDGETFNANLVGEYQYAAGGTRPLTFSEVETIIRGDRIAKLHPGRMEFGSIKMDERTAVIEVAFVSPDGRMAPFLYTLTNAKHSWKIENVQRLWFVPRSHFLRGLQA